MNFAVRSSSICMICEGLASSEGQEQHVKVLRHQDVAHDPESVLAPQLRPGANEPSLEAFGVKDPSPAIGTGGDVVEVIQAVEMPSWHADILTCPIVHCALWVAGSKVG
jgi:hypothetical protein